MAEETKPTTEMIKFPNGTMIKSDGKEYKSDFFKFLELNPDDYSDMVYTAAEAKRIRAHLLHLSTGSAASAPMICGGEAKCPVASRCPFVRETKTRKLVDVTAKSLVPVGRMCPIEFNLLNEYTRFYLQEYDVQENAFTEIQMCRELAEIELLLHRMNAGLAKPENADLIQEDVAGVDKEGNVLTRKGPSALYEVKDRLLNRKPKLIKLMVGDRQEKYKREAALKVRDVDDPSTQTAQLRGRLTKLMDEAKKIDLQLKEASGDVLDAEFSEPADKPKVLTPDDLIGSPQE